MAIENCSCHLSAPCGECESSFQCDVCGALYNLEYLEQDDEAGLVCRNCV